MKALYLKRFFIAVGFLNIAMAGLALVSKIIFTWLPAILNASHASTFTAHQSGTSSIENFATWYFSLWPVAIIPMGLCSIAALVWLHFNYERI